MHSVLVSDRVSIVYVDKGSLERDGHALVLVQDDRKAIVPIGVTAVVMLGPGATVTHAAVSLCAKEQALLIWVGEHGVRVYAAGEPRGKPDALIRQCALHIDATQRLRVARRIFFKMFDEPAPSCRSIEQLRGLEGARVKKWYETTAEHYKITWEKRSNSTTDPLNAALSGASAALYGICEAVILALGYSPSIGFVHSGDARSFVFDVADILKFKTTAPLAFKIAADGSQDIEHRIRTACRDIFFKENLVGQLVETVEDLLHGDGND